MKQNYMKTMVKIFELIKNSNLDIKEKVILMVNLII